MKKRIVLAALVCLALAAGCAKTPENPVVREKDGQNLDTYKEAQESSKQENTGAEISGQEGQEKETEGSVLAERLQVPERYTAQVQSEDGKFRLNCDAEVEIPDVQQVGVYKVGQLPFDDALISRITKGLFGEQPIYDGTKYIQSTQEEILKELEKLKQYQAEGNTDPYGILADMEESGEDFVPEEVYSLQREIDGLEEEYQTAPQEKIKEIVTPSLGEDGHFFGEVEMEGKLYSYRLKRGAGDHMNIRVENQEAGSGMWSDGLYEGEPPEGIELPSEEEARQRAGITQEEAIQKADEYMKNMGFTDFSAKGVKLALRASTTNAMHADYSYKDGKAGYMVYYTRDLDGFPVTSEMNYGGGLESMESTLEPWAYERVEILVNKDGLQYAQILNLYQVGEKQVENVEMKPFPEIAEIFEQMLQIKNADMENEEKNVYQIDRVTLGYMRVYDPGADSASGILVPVWDFFGKKEGEMIIEGETINTSTEQKDYSYLTINAADGTVINRSLGY